MIEQIHWSRRAEQSYGKIIDYIAAQFGKPRARKFVKDVYSEVEKLPANPGLGQVEPLLEGARYEFRRLVIKDLTKVVYRITERRIEIVDVWDVRQDPKELAARVLD